MKVASVSITSIRHSALLGLSFLANAFKVLFSSFFLPIVKIILDSVPWYRV